MSLGPAGRVLLIALQAFVAVTAVAGGAALVVGAIDPVLATVLAPPSQYLAGSPFDSYLVPGLVLALVLGGVHAMAMIAQLRRTRAALMWSGAAGFDALIWIFVQMTIIPFSVLQLVYFAVGIAEIGLVMLALGILPGRGTFGSVRDRPTRAR